MIGTLIGKPLDYAPRLRSGQARGLRQLTLDAVARSRLGDPRTSERAAFEVERQGWASTQRDKCLREVLRKPGQTAAEIAKAAGLERHAASRRLPELREMGLVENRGVRTCTVKERRSIDWWPTKAAMNSWV